MQNEPIAVLDQLAHQLHKKLQTCDIGDANASDQEDQIVPGVFVPSSRESFSKMLKYTREGRKIRILANSTWIQVSVFGKFPLVDPMSINRQDNILQLREPAGKLVVTRSDFPIFTLRGVLNQHQKEVLDNRHFLEAINTAGLTTRELFELTKGELLVYLVHPSFERLTKWVNGLFELSVQIETPSVEGSIDLSKLPVQFHPLIPLIGKWGIADDLEREEALGSAPARVLTSIVNEVEPYITAIDSYLDSFKVEEPNEAACALGRLAEFSVEAKLALRRK